MISPNIAPFVLSLCSATRMAMFVLPVSMLIYIDKGLDMGNFFLYQGIGALVVGALAMISGYMADILSRKLIMVLSRVLWVLGYIALALAKDYSLVMVSIILLSVSTALSAGTVQAYLYDLLAKIGKEQHFQQHYSRLKVLNNVFLLGATLLGGVLYKFMGINAPAVFCAVFAVVSLILALILPRVKPVDKVKKIKNKNNITLFFSIAKKSFIRPDIRWLILFPALFTTLATVLTWGMQSVMVDKKVPVLIFSLVLGLSAAAKLIWSEIASVLFNIKVIVWVLIASMCAGMVGAVFASGVSGFLLYLCFGVMIVASGAGLLLIVASSALLNKRVETSERATVLSVNVMVSQIVLGFLLMGLKPLFDSFSVKNTFMVACAFLIPLIYFGILLLNSISAKNIQKTNLHQISTSVED